MRAGLLRHSASFEKSSETQDTSGAPVNTWTEQFTRRFRVSDSTGREFLSAQQTTAEMTHLFVFRYIDVVESDLLNYRISYDSRVFEIESVVNRFERNRETHIGVREIV